MSVLQAHMLSLERITLVTDPTINHDLEGLREADCGTNQEWIA